MLFNWVDCREGKTWRVYLGSRCLTVWWWNKNWHVSTETGTKGAINSNMGWYQLDRAKELAERMFMDWFIPIRDAVEAGGQTAPTVAPWYGTAREFEAEVRKATCEAVPETYSLPDWSCETDNLVVVDCETTGWAPSCGCLWAFAAVALYEGRKHYIEFDLIARPDPKFFTASHRDTLRKVSRLTDEEILALQHATPLADGLKSWEYFLSSLPARPTKFTSYNVAFDRKFLPWIEQDQWHRCLMREVCRKLGGGPAVKLAVACEEFGIEVDPDELHTARGDAHLAAQLALAIGMSRSAMDCPPPARTTDSAASERGDATSGAAEGGLL